jgi:hypothetical protein
VGSRGSDAQRPAADNTLADGFLLKADHDTGIQDAMNTPIPK